MKGKHKILCLICGFMSGIASVNMLIWRQRKRRE